jgi:hypothetical protein
MVHRYLPVMHSQDMAHVFMYIVELEIKKQCFCFEVAKLLVVT